MATIFRHKTVGRQRILDFRQRAGRITRRVGRAADEKPDVDSILLSADVVHLDLIAGRSRLCAQLAITILTGGPDIPHHCQ